MTDRDIHSRCFYQVTRTSPTIKGRVHLSSSNIHHDTSSNHLNTELPLPSTELVIPFSMNKYKIIFLSVFLMNLLKLWRDGKVELGIKNNFSYKQNDNFHGLPIAILLHRTILAGAVLTEPCIVGFRGLQYMMVVS